jgi:hypothetical protein
VTRDGEKRGVTPEFGGYQRRDFIPPNPGYYGRLTHIIESINQFILFVLFFSCYRKSNLALVLVLLDLFLHLYSIDSTLSRDVPSGLSTPEHP